MKCPKCGSEMEYEVEYGFNDYNESVVVASGWECPNCDYATTGDHEEKVKP